MDRQRSMSFSFDLARAGWMTLAASALAAFTAAAPDQARAQVLMDPDGNVSSYSSTVKRSDLVPTDEENAIMGAKRHANPEDNILAPHFAFLQFMHNAQNGSCCHMKDGIVIGEDDIQYTDNPYTPMRVRLTHTQYGLELSEPVWVDIPASKVLTPEHAKEICEPYKEAAEAHGIQNTCEAPPFSVVWLYDYTSYNANSGEHNVNGKTYHDGDIVPVEEYKQSYIPIYCVWESQPAM